MKRLKAFQIMSALAQPTRWAVYELLVGKMPGGMSASDIADAVKMSRTAMSPHFAILEAAGLLSSVKSGRNITYRARTRPVEDLNGFLAAAVERDATSQG